MRVRVFLVGMLAVLIIPAAVHARERIRPLSTARR
jgi:hypothetical protein